MSQQHSIIEFFRDIDGEEVSLKLVYDRLQHKLETFLRRSVSIKKQNLFAVFKFTQVLLVLGPDDHLEVACRRRTKI
jgi:hypothetical protein